MFLLHFLAVDERIKDLNNDANHLRNYIGSRVLPVENQHVKEKTMKLEEEVRMRGLITYDLDYHKYKDLHV